MISCFCAAAQSKHPANRFIQFLNNYQRDSLANLLDDDFLMTRTYAKYTNDKQSFLGKYIDKSKAGQAKFIVLKEISIKEPRQYLVADESNFFKYLGLKSPNWKLTISTKGDKVLLTSIDTTTNYRKYLLELKVKDGEFNAWLTQKYPKETSNTISKNDTLFNSRLKEYWISKGNK